MAKERKPLPRIEKNRECLKTDCKEDLHCFRKPGNRRKGEILKGQECYECGADPVDWKMVYRRNLKNVQGVFDFMKKEWIRNKYWTIEIDEKALDSAKRLGKQGMKLAIEKRLKSSVGGEKPYFDGGQTPMDGNILYYAQHATACCCRKCIEYWHGIQAGNELTASELDYLTNLMLIYVDERLPNLNEIGEKKPRKNPK